MVTATAKNAAGSTTENYDGTWFKLTAGSLTGISYTTATGALSAGAPNGPTVVNQGAGVTHPPTHALLLSFSKEREARPDKPVFRLEELFAGWPRPPGGTRAESARRLQRRGPTAQSAS